MGRRASTLAATMALVAAGTAAGGAGAAVRTPARPPARAAAPQVTMVVDVATGHRSISPLIYGINDDKDVDGSFSADLAETHAGLVRLGGNRWTAYNWVDNASNAGSDYQYENDDFLTPSKVPGYAVLPTVQAAEAAGAGAIVTVPINGYVSADESPPGPVQNSGPNYLQTRFKVEVPTDPNKLTTTPDPNAKDVYENQFVYWLMKTAPKARVIFELDNEPDLWDSTHAEVHPAQTTYAELLQKDLAYAKAIKAVWPTAEVSGPVSYGWEGYETLQNAPDSSKDGNFLDWYLKNVAAADKQAKETLVDDLDLHWYPEASDAAGTRITGTDVTPAEVVAHEQAPRSLWDPSYVEDSWITADSTNGQPIELIPRVDGQIAANDPGAKLAITEWNYGGGQDVSGAIASADVLGIFGRYGVHAAAWWGLNANESYSLAAFAAFRNYDGHGSSFGDTEVTAATSDPKETSVYGSVQSTDHHRAVIVAVNKNDTTTTAQLKIAGGFTTTSAAVWTLTSAGPCLVAAPSLSATGADTFTYTMPAQSVSVIVPAYAGPAPAVAVAATPDGRGYFVACSDGEVIARGDAHFYGDMSGGALNQPLVGIAVDPATGGYWLLGADGGIFSFHAKYYGSTGGMHLTAPAVGIAAVKGGDGYRIVASDGGIFDFGPGARYLGSMGGRHLNRPIVGMADDLATGGYWLVASDGGIFSFGARYLGSTGAIRLNRPIVEMEAMASGTGYRFVAGDGGVFDFGAARYSGSLGGTKLSAPVVGMAAGPLPKGYLVVQSNGAVTAFGMSAPT